MELLVRIINFALFLAHFIAGILTLLIALETFPDIKSNSVFPIYYARQIWVDCVDRRHENITTLGADKDDIRQWCNETLSKKAMTYAMNVWIDLDLGWIITAYFLWTGVAHLLYSTVLWAQFSETLQNRMRWKWRWVEYSVSAGLMFFIILYFFGITDVVQLVGFSLSMGGLILMPAIVSEGDSLAKKAYIFSTIFYLFLWVYPTARILGAYWGTLENIPWFVWIIISGEFILFSLFPVVFLFESRLVRAGKPLYLVEIFYAMLSAVSKLLLGVVLGFFVFM